MKPLRGTITEYAGEAPPTGFIELPLSDDAVTYGKRLKARYDDNGIKDAFRKPGPDKRWLGHAVEYELHRWLAEEGIEHVWYDDGVASGKSEDFDLGGLKLAVKANSGDRPRPDFVFLVQEHHARKLSDGVLFCLAHIATRRIWIAGYIDADEFRSKAWRHRKGEEITGTGRPAEYPCRTIKAEALVPADKFIEMMRRAA